MEGEKNGVREKVSDYSAKGGHVPFVRVSPESGDCKFGLTPIHGPVSSILLPTHSRAMLEKEQILNTKSPRQVDFLPK